MKLVSLELDNFRNFYGRHRIDFAMNPTRPLTIFIGENGSGKTTLLNAIFWSFTGKFTKLFDSSFALINKDALSEGAKYCAIELTFDDGKFRYRLRRTQYHSESSSRLVVMQVDQDGISIPINEQLGQSYLSKFMPERLASWFIFDGEAIDQIHLSGDTKFRSDLRSTFGFSEMVALIERLQELVSEYSRQEAKLIKSDELDDINEKLEKWTLDRRNCEESIAELEETIALQERIEHSASQELMGMAQSKIIESQIDRTERLRQETKTKKNAKEKERNTYLVRNIPSVFLKNKVLALEKTFRVKEKEQRLPHPFGTRLIDDIKTLRKCICGAEVLPGSSAEKHLEALMDKASTSQLNQRISLLRSCLTTLKGQSQDYEEKVNSFTGDIGLLEQQIADCDQIIREAELKLKGIPQEKIQELLKKKDIARSEQNRATQEKGFQYAKLQRIDKDIRDSDSRRKQILAAQSQNIKLRKEREKIEKLKAYVEHQFERQEQEILATLSSEVSSVLERYLTKHYFARIDPNNYSVKTYDSENREIILSTGEMKVLKFAVIAAIVGMAGSRTKSSKVNWITEPIIAPLIFDAPFSHNDSGYRASIAGNLSDLAEQLIFLFDGDKWDTEIATLLQLKVGKFYLLVSNAKGVKKEVQKKININEKIYFLNNYNADRDESHCIEVSL
jgi:DNA sulfur modification protein DndD